jgi:uncharacterized pyridoxamine 5'-phosphate oxidase family protein
MVGLTIKLTPNPAASNIAVAIIPTNCTKPWLQRAGSNGMSASGKPYILTARQKSLSPRLVKNAQMQGSSFDKLRINSPEE